MNYNGRLILFERLVKNKNIQFENIQKTRIQKISKRYIEGIIIDKDDKFIFINPLVQRKTSEIINNNKQTNVLAALFSASFQASRIEN